MKKLPILLFNAFIIILLSGCGGKPSAHPKHPHYEIHKPKVKYKPNKKSLAKMVKQLQGSPYVWAEEGPNTFDCSGFTYYLYGSMGIDIPRTAHEQAGIGKRVSPNQLQYGDLIFFATNKHNRHRISHVGMYLGNGWFTHASTVKNEVIYSNLFKSRYYKNRLRVCRRYLPEKQLNIRNTQQTLWAKTTSSQSNITPKSKQKKKAILIHASINQLEHPIAKGHFYVQVGSFIGEAKHDLIKRITLNHLRYKIIQYSQNHQQISKVLIGPYPSRKKALTLLTYVQMTIEPNAFIAEIR